MAQQEAVRPWENEATEYETDGLVKPHAFQTTRLQTVGLQDFTISKTASLRECYSAECTLDVSFSRFKSNRSDPRIRKSLSDFPFEERSSFSGKLASLTASNLSNLVCCSPISLKFQLNFSSLGFCFYVQSASLVRIFGLSRDFLLFWWQWRSSTSFCI